MREINPTATEKLARKLWATSLAWARTFLICAGRRDAGLELSVAEQVVAYSLCLLAERLKPFANAEVLVERVRARCRELHAECAGRTTHRHRRLPAAPTPPDGPDFGRAFLECYAQPEAAQRAFAEFCRATGLSSSVLYGRGENLATLVFYIVLHVGISAQTPLPRQRTVELLRAMRECRMRLESFVREGVADLVGERPVEAAHLPPYAGAPAALYLARTAGPAA